MPLAKFVAEARLLQLNKFAYLKLREAPGQIKDLSKTQLEDLGIADSRVDLLPMLADNVNHLDTCAPPGSPQLLLDPCRAALFDNLGTGPTETSERCSHIVCATCGSSSMRLML